MIDVTTARNRHPLGPRTRAVLLAVARAVNPVVKLVAGRRRMPIIGILHHVGRRSGKAYATPLAMRPMGDGFVIARTFGEQAAWYRNVAVASSCQVIYRGRTHSLVEPELLDYATARPGFPRYERGLLRLIGINEYVHLRVARVESPTTNADLVAWPEEHDDSSAARHLRPRRSVARVSRVRRAAWRGSSRTDHRHGQRA